MTVDMLYARVDDMLYRAGRGEVTYSGFLNENERACIARYLRGKGDGIAYRFYGGYEDAQRTRLFIYPDYFEFEDIYCSVCAVEIKGSGFAALHHSSFLGALTALGIERSKMGDIVVRQNSAVLIADENIAKFLLSSPSPLERVGRDSVKLFSFDIPKDFSNPLEYKDIFDTVASPRLDAVTAALANLAREKAKALVASGNVLLNYLEETRYDAVISKGDILTVRGVGKFRIESIEDKTKKGRYKLTAKKYI